MTIAVDKVSVSPTMSPAIDSHATARDKHWLRPALVAVRDVWTMDRPAVFGPAKDRPVLFTAAAWAEVLLTLDLGDFGAVMGSGFCGLNMLMPGDFLERERAEGTAKARRDAMDGPPPTTVRAYQTVYGRDPKSWPPV